MSKNSRSTLLRVFDLPENASKETIRKTYRKLVMRYHPDKNPDPKAHQLFVELTAVYEALMNDQSIQTSYKTSKRRQTPDEQRIKHASKRFENQKIRKVREQQIYFEKLTSGFRWIAFLWIMRISTSISALLFIEPILDSRFEKQVVTGYSTNYNGLEYENVRCIKTNASLQLFVSNPSARIFFENPEIIVERSWIFRNPLRIWFQSFSEKHAFPIDFSVINLYPLVPILLLLPLFTYFYKRMNYKFTFLYYFSLYIHSIILIWFLFTQDRWAHLLTFGYL
jgi:hypothetical protein